MVWGGGGRDGRYRRMTVRTVYIMLGYNNFPSLSLSLPVRVCVCSCVRACPCVRAWVSVCVRVRACVRAWVFRSGHLDFNGPSTALGHLRTNYSFKILSHLFTKHKSLNHRFV